MGVSEPTTTVGAVHAADAVDAATRDDGGDRSDRRSISPRAAVLGLGAIVLVSLLFRWAWIDTPDRTVFDEAYYVNAARIIDGIRPPGGGSYATAPLGIDPNHEHPPLGKVLIAWSIRVLGDQPIGWRMPSLLAGTIAIVMMFVLVRSAGGPLGLALAAAGLLSAENLFFIHGRIATLDVLILPFMLGAVGLYVGRRRRLAGLLIGIGMCIKLVAAAVIPILLLWELLTLGSRRSGGTWPALRRALLDTAACTAFALLAYGLLLQALDMRFTTFSNAVSHTSHMLTYAKNQPETPRARPGFAAAATSTPWQWLLNERPILYYQEVTPPPGPVRQVAVFQGRMSPWLAYLAMPALVAAIARWWRRRDAVSAVIVAWFAGAFGTLIAVSLGHRFNYLYYMLIVVPGLCLGIAALLRSSWVPRLVRWLFVGVVSWGFIALYPIRVGFLR